MSSKIGIFDPKGKNNNPLTKQPYSEQYVAFAKQWSKLPAYKIKEDFVEMVKQNQVIILTSGTGSGKTVLIPKFVLHALDYKGTIITTMPKTAITLSAAQYAAATLDVELGQQVGYQYRDAPADSRSKDTKLLYCTDGTVVAQLTRNPMLNHVDAIIIDEAHERKVQIDMLLLLTKQVLKKRPNFKLIVMSATIDTTLFLNYFKQFKTQEVSLSGTPNFPVESLFLKEPNKKPLEECGVDTILSILKSGISKSTTELNKRFTKLKEKKSFNANGDILLFLTSSNECRKACALLDKKLENSPIRAKILCVSAYSGMKKHAQDLVESPDLYKQEGYDVKVVVATNVAESSWTIPGIVHVIDGGFAIKTKYGVKKDLMIFSKQRITKDSMSQRMGRTGRIGPGYCYHLYTKREMENMKSYNASEIKTANLTSDLLALMNTRKNRHCDTMLAIVSQMIEPLSPTTIKHYLDVFVKYGLVTPSSRDRSLLKKLDGDGPLENDDAAKAKDDAAKAKDTRNTDHDEQTEKMTVIYKDYNLELTDKGLFVSNLSNLRLGSALLLYEAVMANNGTMMANNGTMGAIRTIVAALETVNYKPFSIFQESPTPDMLKMLDGRGYISNSGDLSTLYRIITAFIDIDQPNRQQWCDELNLKQSVFVKAEKIISKLETSLKTLVKRFLKDNDKDNVQHVQTDSPTDPSMSVEEQCSAIIKKALCMNVAVKVDKNNVFLTQHNHHNQRGTISRNSFGKYLTARRSIDKIVYMAVDSFMRVEYSLVEIIK